MSRRRQDGSCDCAQDDDFSGSTSQAAPRAARRLAAAA